MKKLIAALVVSAAMATPALAQSYNPDMGTGNVGPAPYTGVYGGGYRAFAYSPAPYWRAWHHHHYRHRWHMRHRHYRYW